MSYNHDSTLGNQLRAWTRLRAKVASAIQEFDAGHWLVVDPDSWMTQFGLLPLADDRYCRYFDSRSYAEQSKATLAQLANEWANQWFFWGGVEALPYVVRGYGPESGSHSLLIQSQGELAGVSFSTDGHQQVRLGPTSRTGCWSCFVGADTKRSSIVGAKPSIARTQRNVSRPSVGRRAT